MSDRPPAEFVEAMRQAMLTARAPCTCGECPEVQIGLCRSPACRVKAPCAFCYIVDPWDERPVEEIIMDARKGH